MPHTSAPRLCRALVVAPFVLLPTLPVAAQDANELSQNLIALRGEVESLNSELELVREEQRAMLASLAQQKAELEAQRQRQELATREAREKIARQAEQTAEAGVAGEILQPVLLQAIADLRNHIQAGLPFKTGERLAALDEIAQQIRSGTLQPARAANRLWAFFEDEFRITRETGLHKQTIRLGSENVLADVAKVGSMMLFFRTQDGQFGYARKDQGGWGFVTVEDSGEREQVAALFDSLNKQIRQGYFELPAVAPLGGG